MDKRTKRTARTGRSDKREGRDVNVAAHSIVNKFAAGTERPMTPTDAEVSKVMAMLGRKGGKIGGRKRADSLSEEERKEIARRAARTRWDKQQRP